MEAGSSFMPLQASCAVELAELQSGSWFSPWLGIKAYAGDSELWLMVRV